MTPADIPDLGEAWAQMGRLLPFGPAKILPADVEMLVRVFEPFTLAEVLEACSQQIAEGRQFPAPAEIIERIRGRFPGNEVLIQLASEARSPLGLEAHRLIGAHALTHTAADTLLRRMSRWRDDLQQWCTRVQDQGYTDAEIVRLHSAGIDVLARLCPSMHGPRAHLHETLTEKSRTVQAPLRLTDSSGSGREIPEDERQRISEQINAVVLQLQGAMPSQTLPKEVVS